MRITMVWVIHILAIAGAPVTEALLRRWEQQEIHHCQLFDVSAKYVAGSTVVFMAAMSANLPMGGLTVGCAQPLGALMCTLPKLNARTWRMETEAARGSAQRRRMLDRILESKRFIGKREEACVLEDVCRYDHIGPCTVWSLLAIKKNKQKKIKAKKAWDQKWRNQPLTELNIIYAKKGNRRAYILGKVLEKIEILDKKKRLMVEITQNNTKNYLTYTTQINNHWAKSTGSFS